MDQTRISLYVNLKKQKEAFNKLIQKNIKQPIEIEIGMSYGQPSIANAIDKLKEKNCNKILFFLSILNMLHHRLELPWMDFLKVNKNTKYSRNKGNS